MADSRRPLVLVVDGDEGRRAETTDYLTARGYGVRAAPLSADAQTLLQEGGLPDLVLLGASVATADARSICAALKAVPEAAGVPVLLIAARAEAEERTLALESGVGDVLAEPVDPPELLACVRSLLRVKSIHDSMAGELRRLTEIGIALSAEHDLDRLLDRILSEARAINHADAGTLYAVDPDACVLHYEIVQNDTLGIHLGGPGGNRASFRPVAMDPSNVSGYVALTGAIVNIPDVYQYEGFNFSGPRESDARLGYRSQSMLVMPMRNHEDEVIAVLQLINAKDPQTGQVVPFSASNVERTRALASQAVIALTNARLVHDLEAFVEGLIQAMATAVDEKSHYTHGHIQRVTRLALLLAEAINTRGGDRFEGRRFSADELEELRVAGMLHDIGKIVVPEHVVDKATKLQCVYDRIEAIRSRFSVIRRGIENAALRRKLDLLRSGAGREALQAIDEEVQQRTRELAEDLAFLESINPGAESMAPEHLARLHAIAAQTYCDDEGNSLPFLTQSEVNNLAIPRGTLLPEEFQVVRGHAAVSSRLLRQIPFARKLRNVPVFAGDHHEALNGSGYPGRKSAPDLPLQSRILAVVDIFDALTSSDRPYKKAYSMELAHKILREEAERGKLDSRLVELFIAAGCYGRLQQEQSASPKD